MSRNSTEVLEAIGREVGVSTRTVSRVLNGQIRDTRPTIVKRAEQIHMMAKRLGYRPNAAAKAISTGRFGSVGLLMSRSDEVSMLPWRLLQSITDALAEHDHHLIHAALPDEELAASGFVPRVLREFACDAFLINYTHRIPAAMVAEIEASTAPSIWMNVRRKADCVYPDDQDAGRRAVQALIEAGHRRIAYADLSHPSDQVAPHHSNDDRESGYQRAMLDSGLTPLSVRPGRFLPPQDRAAFFAAQLDRPDRPTAFVCYGHTTTVPLTMAAHDLRLGVPQDISIISFAEKSDGLIGVMTAAMILPYDAMGREAVRQLTSKVERGNEARLPVAIPFEFDPGDSIAPPGDI